MARTSSTFGTAERFVADDDGTELGGIEEVRGHVMQALHGRAIASPPRGRKRLRAKLAGSTLGA